MPAQQPFTLLCQEMSRSRSSGRADLHLHSVHSDGSYTPAQIVDLARRSGLAAVAITDHDTVNGIAEARSAAAGSSVEIISGVEITAEFQGRELHLLGYFFDSQDAGLLEALEQLRRDRRGRFQEMVERLKACGVTLDEQDLPQPDDCQTLGRRHLAEWLVRAGRVGSMREAFTRYLGDGRRADVPKRRLAVTEAIALVRGAGGVAAWAHPPADDIRARLFELRALGLEAIEVEYPGRRPGQARGLRALADSLHLAIVGGSDCHGPDDVRRAVGGQSISRDDLERLREAAKR